MFLACTNQSSKTEPVLLGTANWSSCSAYRGTERTGVVLAGVNLPASPAVQERGILGRIRQRARKSQERNAHRSSRGPVVAK
jgi:hypothetical protein